MKSSCFFHRFLLTLTTSFIFLSFDVSAKNQTYYKWYDENGNLHFSDRLPSNIPTKVEQNLLKNDPLNIPLFDSPTQKSDSSSTSNKPNRVAAQKIHLISPKNEATFHTNNGTIELKFITDYPLSAEQYTRVIIDNKVYLQSRTSPLTITGLNRGEHELKIDLIENKNIIASSEKVRFFIHSASVITPKGQAIMAPKAPTLTTLPEN